MMRKQILLLALFAVSTAAYAQQGRVGINTSTPKTTMDINGKADVSGISLATDVTGLQAPRLTRLELTNKGNTLYGTDQKGALVYITDVSAGDNLSQRINITATGYYYFDGSLWQKVGSGSIAGDKTDDEWINDPANAMVKLGKKSDGTTARDTNTDFVALDNGNVGIGTAAPTQKLEIKTTGTAAAPVTGFKLGDGNQSAGYVLTSDANGIGTWRPIAIERINGVLGAGVNIPFTNNNFLRTGSYIDLPQGKWEVSVTMLMPVTAGTMTTNDWLWMKTTFSGLNQASINDGQQTADFVGTTYLASGMFSGPRTTATNQKYDMLFGKLIINNNTTLTKRYYYYAGLLDAREYTSGTGKSTQFDTYGGNAWGENSIVAVRIQ